MSTNLDMPRADRITLPDLVDRLTAHGVTVPGLDSYRRLKATVSDYTPPAVARPDELLKLDPAELLAYVQRAALRGLIGTGMVNGRESPYILEMIELSSALDDAMRAEIRDSASQIIADLRKPFTASAAVMQKAVKLGIKPSDDLRSLFEADGPVRTTWLSTHAHARKLDELLTVRQALSFVAGVEPNTNRLMPNQILNHERGFGSGIDWTVTVSADPTGPRLEPFDAAAPWRRWIKLGASLALVDPAEMTDFEALRASSAQLADELQQEAERRERQDLAIQAPTEAAPPEEPATEPAGGPVLI